MYSNFTAINLIVQTLRTINIFFIQKHKRIYSTKNIGLVDKIISSLQWTYKLFEYTWFFTA